MKIVIVGGSLGGLAALARLRRLDETVELVLFDRGEHLSRATCGLPYHVGGVIQARDALLVPNAENLSERLNATIRMRHSVEAIDPNRKVITVADLDNEQTFEESYDNLLLALGSSQLKPKIPGIDGAGIFTLWTVSDADRLNHFIRERNPKHAVVVGGGSLGLEAAENLVERGLRVEIAELSDQILPFLDPDMAGLAEAHLSEKGVQLHLRDGVRSFEEIDNGKIRVMLLSDTAVETDLVVLATGVTANSDLARRADLKVSARGGIVVDDTFRTTDRHIYAVGDAIQVRDYITGQPTMAPLAGPAVKQGRLVASHLLGLSAPMYPGTQETTIVQVFDRTCASTGKSEKQLQAMGLILHEQYEKTVVHVLNHDIFYPDAERMTIKLIYSLQGNVLGAQIVGSSGVDKRIDVLATAIHFGASITDLTELELAYAPPYNSISDPINVIGNAAENERAGLTRAIPAAEGLALVEFGDTTLLDVRESGERAEGVIEGAVHIPINELRQRLDELASNRPVLVYCDTGQRGYFADRILRSSGFTSMNMQGGFRSYVDGVRREQMMKSSPARVAEELELHDSSSHTDETDIELSSTVSDQREEMPATIAVQSMPEQRHEQSAEQPIALQSTFTPLARAIRLVVFSSGYYEHALTALSLVRSWRVQRQPVILFCRQWGIALLRRETATRPSSRQHKRLLREMGAGLKHLRSARAGHVAQQLRELRAERGLPSLEALWSDVRSSGIRLIADAESLKMFGLSLTDLVDGVEVASFDDLMHGQQYAPVVL